MMARRRGLLPVLCPVLVACLLHACADKPPAPIEDRSRGGTARPEQRYTVLRGDTLYAIAFRYGFDYRRLAAANSIPAPFTIYPGQALVLREADPPRPTAPPVAATRASKRSDPGARASSSTRGASDGRAPEPKVAPVAKAATREPRPTASTSPPPATGNVAVRGWTWPASGRVIRGFDANLHKGISIVGERGDPVRATAGGRVVYAGSGIAGYGLMLIVRHNDEYLSAYGHNDELLVAEGSVVRSGQTIARFGNTGTDRVQLHFEIRREGRPVDPRRLLPER